MDSSNLPRPEYFDISSGQLQEYGPVNVLELVKSMEGKIGNEALGTIQNGSCQER